MISVIIPVYNEENFIAACIDSLLTQDYPQNDMEWIFIDGGSTDRTKEIIYNYQKIYHRLIQLLDNPYKTVPYSMNIGIKQAIGRYIIRLDAHADYARDYISKCVYYLDNTDADNVGGVAKTKSKGFWGNAIAKMLSTKFGVGNSSFRINGKDGYVDTVPFGAYRREVFEKLGGYDERLTRNQDNELNYRIRKNGGKIFLSNDIKLNYYCRDSITGIINMAVKNGMWNIITMYLCPGSMGIRHFIPLVFVISLIILLCASAMNSMFLYILILEAILYFSIACKYAMKVSEGLKEMLCIIYLYPCFHVAYGVGSIKGFFKLLGNEFKK